MRKTTLDPDDVIARGEEQVFTVVDGDAVLMSVRNGRYYSLDDIGTEVWHLIERPTAVRTICDHLVREFQVEQAACAAAVRALLDRMLADRLVRVVAARKPAIK